MVRRQQFRENLAEDQQQERRNAARDQFRAGIVLEEISGAEQRDDGSRCDVHEVVANQDGGNGVDVVVDDRLCLHRFFVAVFRKGFDARLARLRKSNLGGGEKGGKGDQEDHQKDQHGYVHDLASFFSSSSQISPTSSSSRSSSVTMPRVPPQASLTMAMCILRRRISSTRA